MKHNRILGRIVAILAAIGVTATAASPLVFAQEEKAMAAVSPLTGDVVAFWTIIGIIVIAAVVVVLTLILKKRGKKK